MLAATEGTSPLGHHSPCLCSVLLLCHPLCLRHPLYLFPDFHPSPCPQTPLRRAMSNPLGLLLLRGSLLLNTKSTPYSSLQSGIFTYKLPITILQLSKHRGTPRLWELTVQCVTFRVSVTSQWCREKPFWPITMPIAVLKWLRCPHDQHPALQLWLSRFKCYTCCRYWPLEQLPAKLHSWTMLNTLHYGVRAIQQALLLVLQIQKQKELCMPGGPHQVPQPGLLD